MCHCPSPKPRWLSLPERGLYTASPSSAPSVPARLWGWSCRRCGSCSGYKAQDAERKLSGIVLEVKGDLCRHLKRILKEYGREQDYVEVSLDGDLRYNPLNNSLDPYAQAFNIASIITAIWGRGKEPFWQQSYTDLVRYVILLHRVRDGYVTMVDIFRTVISAGQLEELLIQVGSRFSMASYIGVSHRSIRTTENSWPSLDSSRMKRRAYTSHRGQNNSNNRWQRRSTLSFQFTSVALPTRRCAAASRASSIGTGEHWKFFRAEVKTSIVQGIAVFLSSFETDPQVRRVFCPPKELYEGKPCIDDPNGRVLPSFEELIESGAVVGLNFPVALNPALAKTIGTMMKVDYQRAVQLRIPKMDAEPHKHFRPTVFICDEYQNFATVAATIRQATNGFCPSRGNRSAYPSLPRRASPV